MKSLLLYLALAALGGTVALPRHSTQVEIDLFSNGKQTVTDITEQFADTHLGPAPDQHVLDDIDDGEKNAIIKKGYYYIEGLDGKEQPVLLGIASEAESGDPLVTAQAKDALPRRFYVWGWYDKIQSWMLNRYGLFPKEDLLIVRFSGESADFWVKNVSTGYYSISNRNGDYWTVDPDVPGRLYLAKVGAGLPKSQWFRFRP